MSEPYVCPVWHRECYSPTCKDVCYDKNHYQQVPKQQDPIPSGVEPDSKLIHSFEYWPVDEKTPRNERLMVFAFGHWKEATWHRNETASKWWVAGYGWALPEDVKAWTYAKNLAPSIDKAKP